MHQCHTLFTTCEHSPVSYENPLTALIPLSGIFSDVQQQPTIICYINVTWVGWGESRWKYFPQIFAVAQHHTMWPHSGQAVLFAVFDYAQQPCVVSILTRATGTQRQIWQLCYCDSNQTESSVRPVAPQPDGTVNKEPFVWSEEQLEEFSPGISRKHTSIPSHKPTQDTIFNKDFYQST